MKIEDTHGKEQLEAAGWFLNDNSFWYHPARTSGGYTMGQALEILGMEKHISEVTWSRDILNETLKKQPWKDGEGGVSYLILSDPAFFNSRGPFSNLGELYKALLKTLLEIKNAEKRYTLTWKGYYNRYSCKKLFGSNALE